MLLLSKGARFFLYLVEEVLEEVLSEVLKERR